MVEHKINLSELKKIAPGLLPTLNLMSMMTYGKSLSSLVLESSNGATEEKIRNLLTKIYHNEEISGVLLNRIKN